MQEGEEERGERQKPEGIARYEEELARALAAERKDAAQGDLLTPALVAYLREQVETVMASPDGASVLATIFEQSPELDRVNVEVNATYPDDAPLGTVPPILLELFPSLPHGMQYRFVGCRLIVLERDARLILDYTEECLWEAEPGDP